MGGGRREWLPKPHKCDRQINAIFYEGGYWYMEVNQGDYLEVVYFCPYCGIDVEELE